MSTKSMKQSYGPITAHDDVPLRTVKATSSGSQTEKSYLLTHRSEYRTEVSRAFDTIKYRIVLLIMLVLLSFLCVVVFFIQAYYNIRSNTYEDSKYYRLVNLSNNTRVQFSSNIYGPSSSKKKDYFIRVHSTEKKLIFTETSSWMKGSTFTVYTNGDCFALKSYYGNYLKYDSFSNSIATTATKMEDATLFAAVSVDSSNEVIDITSETSQYSSGKIIMKQCQMNNWLHVDSYVDPLTNTSVPMLAVRHANDNNYGDNSTTVDEYNLNTLAIKHIDIIKGVNLGGWFIPEVWMCPSFFKDSGLGWGGSLCGMTNYSSTITYKRMLSQFKYWITESDFAQISALGYNSVRLPIGYWNVMKDPFKLFEPKDEKISLYYIDLAFTWAAKYNMTILLDVHGAPGSQNGYDHSGCIERPSWLSSYNIDLTLEAIDIIADRYAEHPALIGFELLNEPSEAYSSKNSTVLLEYYSNAYKIIRKYSKSALIVFNELYSYDFQNWNNRLLEPYYYNVIIDWHLYDWPMTQLVATQHVANANVWAGVIHSYNSYHPILIGEWSMSTGTHQAGQPYVDACVQSFNDHSIGWYLWNWKVERNAGFDEWDVQYQSQIKGLNPL